MGFQFDDSYRARLLALPKALLRGGAAADGAAGRERGGRLEFREHRPYHPGDDPRDIDWGAWLRLGQLLARTYERSESPQIFVLLDRSASMGPEGAAKDRIVREVAGGLAVAALQAGCPAAVGILAEGGPVTLGSWRSHRRIDEVIALLQGLGAPQGPTHLERGGMLAPAPPEGRAVCLISDFLAPTLPTAFAAAASRGQATGALLHVVTEAERDPGFVDGGVYVGLEGEEALRLGRAAPVRVAYARELEAHEEAVAALAHRHALRHALLSDREGFEAAILRAYGLGGVR